MKSSGRALRSGREPGRQRRRVSSYLEQLKQLVPMVPLDRPVSQLEVIQHVIEYIAQLERQLERRQPVSADRRPLQEVCANQAPSSSAHPLKQVRTKMEWPMLAMIKSFPMGNLSQA